MKIEKVGIAGFEGPGVEIAYIVAGAGYPVAIWNADKQALGRGKNAFKQSIDGAIDRAIESGTLQKEKKEQILSQLTFGADITVLKDVDLVIESLPDNLDLKNKAFSDLSDVVRKDTVLATTTSCHSVTEISDNATNPERTLGMHFLKPLLERKLVEVVRALNSSQKTIDLVVDFCSKIGKETVVAKDSPGFIVNYLFVPYMNQALNYYDHGLGDKKGLDTALKMGLGYPKGPLSLIDQSGLDDHLHLTSVLYDRLKDPMFAPPPILKRMVDGGKLGKKSGQGFYNYDEDSL